MFLLSSANIFSKLTFVKKSSINTIRVSNSLDPDQDRHFVGPDLVPNCLQRLSADDKIHFSNEHEEAITAKQIRSTFSV